jgi:RNA polymerase sigma factor (TIGR02999 family)
MARMLRESDRPSVSALLAQFRNGDREAAGQLVELLYPDLQRIASSKMQHERPEHTWQPAVLVNELYLELVKVKALRETGNQDEKDSFMNFAAFLMNRLLARHARPAAKKAVRVEVDEALQVESSGVETLAHIEWLLARLAAIDPKFRTVVELRVFENCTGEEIAARLGCSRKTIDRYWMFASRWLRQELACNGVRVVSQ